MIKRTGSLPVMLFAVFVTASFAGAPAENALIIKCDRAGALYAVGEQATFDNLLPGA